ncbi:hypothetical protein [Leucobacter iarius]|uniref:DUF4352 domain-containing protein n=1 Tax=Leucobacter iarius TaxID=333963 RepID=A0ABN2LGL3_9MICO
MSELSTPSTPQQQRPSQALLWISLSALAMSAIALSVALISLASGSAADEKPSKPAAQGSAPTTQQPQPQAPTSTTKGAPSNASADEVPLKSPFRSASASLTINSVEVMDQIETVDGAPLVADPGTKLVLIRATFTNSSPKAADLSCGDTGLYVRGFDSNQSEMTQVFETYRIPGNMECNAKLLTGQTHDWNIAFSVLEKNTPASLVVVDSGTNNYEQETKLLLK